MASLDCLSIQGIRSFGPDEPQLIHFAKPLTVIVGANGCGKTTIIECLRYVTTGALPPGSASGQSFVHDPKIAGKSEVKGQLKLKFKNRIPQTMVCVRDLQLSQMRSKLQFKALDSVLMAYKVDEHGNKKKVSSTSKCLDMDRMMPTLLGAPRAVLEHVVFCHQEESNWPLQEGKVLKERFDQIFESARYTKALDDLKKQRKAKAAELKEMQAHREAVGLEVARVRQLESQLAGWQETLAALARDDAGAAGQLEQLEAMLQEGLHVQKETVEARQRVERLRSNAASTLATARSLEGDLNKLRPAERTAALGLLQAGQEAVAREEEQLATKTHVAEARLREAASAVAAVRKAREVAEERVATLRERDTKRAASLQLLDGLRGELCSGAAGLVTWAGAEARLALAAPAPQPLEPGAPASALPAFGARVEAFLAAARSAQAEWDAKARRELEAAEAEEARLKAALEKIETRFHSREAEVAALSEQQRTLADDLRREEAEARKGAAKAGHGSGGGGGAAAEDLPRMRAELADAETAAADAAAVASSAAATRQAGGGASKELEEAGAAIRVYRALRDALRGASESDSEARAAATRLAAAAADANTALRALGQALLAATSDGSLRRGGEGSATLGSAAMDDDEGTAAQAESLMLADATASLAADTSAAASAGGFNTGAAERLLAHAAAFAARVTKEAAAAEKEAKTHGEALNSHRRSVSVLLDRLTGARARVAGTLASLQAASNELARSSGASAGWAALVTGSGAAGLLDDLVALLEAGARSTEAVKPSRVAALGAHFSAASADASGGVAGVTTLAELASKQMQVERVIGALREEVRDSLDVDALKAVQRALQRSLRELEAAGTAHGGPKAPTPATFAAHQEPVEATLDPTLLPEEDLGLELGGGAASTQGSSAGGGSAGKTPGCPCCGRAFAADDGGADLRRALAFISTEIAKLEADAAGGAGAGTGATPRARLAAAEALAAGLARASPLLEAFHSEVGAIATALAELASATTAAEDASSRLASASSAASSAKEFLAGPLAAVATARARLTEAVAQHKTAAAAAAAVAPDDDDNGATAVVERTWRAALASEPGLARSSAFPRGMASLPTTVEAAEVALQRTESRQAALREEAFALQSAEAEAATASAAAAAKASALRTALAAAAAAVEAAAAAGRRVEELRERLKGLDTRLAAARADSLELRPQVRTAQVALQDARRAAAAAAGAQGKTGQALASKVAALGATWARVKTLTEEVSAAAGGAGRGGGDLAALLGSGGGGGAAGATDGSPADPNDLPAWLSWVATCKRREAELTAAWQEAHEATTSLAAVRASIGAVKRILELRATAQATVEEATGVEGQMAVHAASLVAVGVRGGNVDAYVEDIRSQVAGVKMAVAKASGQREEIQSSVTAAQKELKRDSLRTAVERSNDLAIITYTLQLAVADLDRYYSVLDTALMRYHKLKIEEINTVIRELWVNTYAGADIDTIEIRSDLEDTVGVEGGIGGGVSTTGAAARPTRSYNYRVVMLKGDAELDMRGRCSAGQKVLASVVIRLALAESFCQHMGILALDEPTTSLDSANKRGLARALARLIELRSGGGAAARAGSALMPASTASRNLQLIVITHDEEFVSELGRQMAGGGGSSSTTQLGTYYRVWREQVREGVYHSRIERQEFDTGGGAGGAP